MPSDRTDHPGAAPKGGAEGTVPEAVVLALQSVLGHSSAPIGLHEPTFAGNEWHYLRDCLDSTFVSSVGAYVDRFERELALYTGAGHAVAVVNGTAALHVALLLAGVQRDHEVLLPALTFVATANAVEYCGAVPHFVDVETRTLGIDPLHLAEHLRRVTTVRDGIRTNRVTGRPLRVLVPMHTFGHPSDLDGLTDVATEFGLTIVEDAAESLGSTLRGRHTGTFGRLGVLSFNGNKTITTGGGGAILTDDPELARRAKHLTTTAKMPHAWEYRHEEVGYNYRMPNLNAALGCAQLEQLTGFLAAKRALVHRYLDAFASVPQVRIFHEPTGARSNYWLQALLLEPLHAHLRDAILSATHRAGILTRPAWVPMHQLPQFADAPRAALDRTEDLATRIINLPSSPGLVGTGPSGRSSGPAEA